MRLPECVHAFGPSDAGGEGGEGGTSLPCFCHSITAAFTQVQLRSSSGPAHVQLRSSSGIAQVQLRSSLVAEGILGQRVWRGGAVRSEGGVMEVWLGWVGCRG
uniref:Uncharacterized protein n=1 Tax=Knipowitschia caucasica TaxID=637954 RepID=A0AAV2MET6_KNICA